METKRCSKCGEVKALDAFGRDASRKSGFSVWCRACRKAHRDRAYRARWYAENREKENAWSARWRVKNPEKVKTESARWYVENSEKLKAATIRRTQALAPGYVAARIGIPVSELTPELLELKRSVIQAKRVIRSIEQEISK